MHTYNHSPKKKTVQAYKTLALVTFLFSCTEAPSFLQDDKGQLSGRTPFKESTLADKATASQTDKGSAQARANTLALGLSSELETALKLTDIPSTAIDLIVDNTKQKMIAKANTLAVGISLGLAETDTDILTLMMPVLIEGSLETLSQSSIKGLGLDIALKLSETVVATSYASISSRSTDITDDQKRNLNGNIVSTAIDTLVKGEDENSAENDLQSQIETITRESVKGIEKLSTSPEAILAFNQETTRSLVKSLSSGAQTNNLLKTKVNTLVEAGMKTAIASIASSSLKDTAGSAIGKITGSAIEGLKDLAIGENDLKISLSRSMVKGTMASLSAAGIAAEDVGDTAKSLVEDTLSALSGISDDNATKTSSSSGIISEIVSGFSGKISDATELQKSVSSVISAGVESLDSLTTSSADSITMMESMVQSAVKSMSDTSVVKALGTNSKKGFLSQVVKSAVVAIKSTKMAEKNDDISSAIRSTTKAATRALAEANMDANEITAISSEIVGQVVPEIKSLVSSEDSSYYNSITSQVLAGSVEALNEMKSNQVISSEQLNSTFSDLTDAALEAANESFGCSYSVTTARIFLKTLFGSLFRCAEVS